MGVGFHSKNTQGVAMMVYYKAVFVYSKEDVQMGRDGGERPSPPEYEDFGEGDLVLKRVGNEGAGGEGEADETGKMGIVGGRGVVGVRLGLSTAGKKILRGTRLKG